MYYAVRRAVRAPGALRAFVQVWVRFGVAHMPYPAHGGAAVQGAAHCVYGHTLPQGTRCGMSLPCARPGREPSVPRQPVPICYPS